MIPPMATDIQSTMDTQSATFSDRLTVNGVAARRSKAPKMAGGIAAHASSDMFKGPVRLFSTMNCERQSDTRIGTRQTKC